MKASLLVTFVMVMLSICRRQIWEEMRAAAERNRQQITGQPPRSGAPSRPSSRPSSQPPTRPPSPPRSQPVSRPASRPHSPPQSRPESRPASRPTSRSHSPPSLDPVQALAPPRAAAPRQGLPPRAQPGHALPSGRAPPQVLPAIAAPAETAAVRHAAVQTQHSQQPQHGQHGLPALAHLSAAPQTRADAQLPPGQQPLQPSSPAGPEMLHQVEFVVPGAAKKDDVIPSGRIADLQRAGQDSGSGGSLEGVSELQPIPKLSPRAAAEEEAEYGQMVEEMQQVSVHLCLSVCLSVCLLTSAIYMHQSHSKALLGPAHYNTGKQHAVNR